MNKNLLVICISMAILLSAGCSEATLSPEDQEATMAVALEQTIAAQPTNTVTITPTASPTATKTPAPEPTELIPEKSFIVEISDDGWAHYTYEGDGFKVSIPPNWQHLDLSADDLEEMFIIAGESNPMLTDFYSPTYFKNLAAAGMKLMAVDTSVASLSSGMPTNLNLLVTDLIIDLTFDDYVAISIQQVQALIGEDTPIQNERIEINGQAAEKLTYMSELYDPLGTSHDFVFNQYLFLEGRTQYILTIGSIQELSAINSDLISDIAASFEIIQ